LKKEWGKAVVEPKPPKKDIAKLVMASKTFEGLAKDNERKYKWSWKNIRLCMKIKLMS